MQERVEDDDDDWPWCVLTIVVRVCFLVCGESTTNNDESKSKIVNNKILPGGTEGYPAQPGLICPSVHACRLGIERKMTQAQQIWSNFLQDHEST